MDMSLINKLKDEIIRLNQENERLSGMLNLESRNYRLALEREDQIVRRVLAAEQVMKTSIKLVESTTKALVTRELGDLPNVALQYQSLLDGYVSKYNKVPRS